MAKLDPSILFNGSLGNLVAYRLPGSDQVVVRSKGHVSKIKYKTSPAFANLRRNNAEFSGRATMSKWIMRMMWPQKALADYNIAGPINALLKPIQQMDTVSEWGQRSIRLSQARHLLEGFSLNRGINFDSVLRSQLRFELSRAEAKASVTIPALIPRVNFFPATRPFFSVIIVLGVVPDLLFSKSGVYEPSSPAYNNLYFSMAATPWAPCNGSVEETSLEVSLSGKLPDENNSLLLSAGIRYGQVRGDGSIEQTPYGGAAKVMALG
jgi:hypothetical protein